MEVAGKLTPGSSGGAAWGPGRHLARGNSVRKGLHIESYGILFRNLLEFEVPINQNTLDDMCSNNFVKKFKWGQLRCQDMRLVEVDNC